MAKKKESSEEGSLAKELRGLIPQLDSEGLAFLIEQARVHIYNMQVDTLNNAASAVNSSRRTSAAKSAAKPATAVFKIEGSDSGSSYYLSYGNDNIMFSRGEMTQIVNIINGKGTELEIRGRLYNWFESERRDIFSLVNMPDKFDTRLKTLVSLIKKSFKIRKT